MNTPLPRPTYIDDFLVSAAFHQGSRLVYGTSGLGGVWGKVDKGESVAALLYALDKGIHVFDTAPSYSMAETYMGEALRQWTGPVPFISTKVGRLRAEDAHTTRTDYSPAGMRNSFYNSLETLGVDHVDLLFLHEPQLVPLANLPTILEVLHEFKAKGLALQIGVGGNPTPEFMPYIKKENFDVVSGFLHLDACNLTALEHQIPQFQQEGIAYYAASALHFSLLGNRFERYAHQEPNEWITREDQLAAIAVNDVAKQYGMPLPSLAQRYLFSIQEADRIVIGARTLPQIQSTLTDWEAGKLPQPLFEEVTTAILEARSL